MLHKTLCYRLASVHLSDGHFSDTLYKNKFLEVAVVEAAL